MDAPPKVMISLGEAVAILHGIALFPGLTMPGLAEAMSFLIQRELRTPSAMRAAMPLCRRVLLDQHPWLDRIIVPFNRLVQGDQVYLWCWRDAVEHRHREHLVDGKSLVVETVDASDVVFEDLLD
jgi:hypothetical protein